MCGGSGAVMSIIPPRGCGTDDPARQQMQAVLHAARKLPVLLVEIFRIADDRVADMRHVGAQLVGAAGDRLEREPGQLPRRGLDHGVIGDRVAGALLAVAGDAHERIRPRAPPWRGRSRYGPAAAWARQRPAPSRSCAPSGCGRSWPARRRQSGSWRPAGSRRCPCRAGAPGAGAGPPVPQHLQHAVEMARGAGAALHREPHRLVEHQHVGILVAA